MYEHQTGTLEGFTKRYECTRLVFYEIHGTMEEAIFREKKIKGKTRKKKLALIETMNPLWKDLMVETP